MLKSRGMRIPFAVCLVGVCAAGCSSQSPEDACVASGGTCVLGAAINCTKTGNTCESPPDSPGGSICCYAFSDGGVE